MRSYENEPIVVQREVKAVAIPAGVEVNLKLGSVGYITQALGGSFTVYIDGNLFRIAGQDADAIGKTAAKPPDVPPGASEEDIKNVVWQQLKTCYDPEIPVNIVDLGLVYACDVSKNADETRTVDIKMTLTAAAWARSWCKTFARRCRSCRPSPAPTSNWCSIPRGTRA
jgi:probable FeS assembly SUF system protein SufT